MSNGSVPSVPGPSKAGTPRSFKQLPASLVQLVTHPAFSPFIRAYSLGLAFSSIPSLIRITAVLVLSKRRVGLGARVRTFLCELGQLTLDALDPRSLGMASGVALGGAKLGQGDAVDVVGRVRLAVERYRLDWGKLEHVVLEADEARERIEADSKRLAALKMDRNTQAIATFASGSLSSLLAITLLQSHPTYRRAPAPTAAFAEPTPYAGLATAASTTISPRPVTPTQSQTLDFTLFLLVRAVDSLARLTYELTGVTRGAYGRVLQLLANQADAVMFWLSSWRVMWCWFYKPAYLPPSYNSWILALARMDPGLLELLRLIRVDRYVYGSKPDDEVARLCKSIAGKMGRDERMVNPQFIRRLDCDFVHGPRFTGTCEVHAAKRWAAAFVDALKIYIPVHFVPQLLFNSRALARTPSTSLAHTIIAASRSSAFLATFIASIYQSVCLVRSRIPALLPQVAPVVWDSGLCAGLGCMLCGLSILIESKRRRREMSLFVTTRALYTLMDDFMPSVLAKGRKGELLSQWIERAVFALSTGGVITAAVHRPDLISGVTRGVLAKALGPWAGAGAPPRLPKKSRSLP